ncbi:SDR family oxidoreductase [Exiguobacterium oxidotolerans]|uniref:Putative 3-oxoacyl- acyl-carrier protein reductase n=1 Tax=Exiguobacterium oxidotolerans TaxID=223958 RepID=A0A653IB75_9BACL|nr:SDR family oxidoreductase [Exiguobacterium oxidotolerans]VWX36283.1 putative 3-oxoacyl- acyl-carrier protein reductase [Exiguobacterium oxidotolerans]
MRHALITAGTKGLGEMVTRRLLDEGWYVTALHRSKPEFTHERLYTIQADVTEQAELLKAVDRAMEKHGRIDALILNAGPYVFERKALVDYSDEEWNEVVGGNLTASFWLLRKVIPIMRDQHYGRVITYGFPESATAPGWVYRAAFAAAKSGMVSLTKSVALEEAEHGITANMVNPGNIVGDNKTKWIDEAVADDQTPVGRTGVGGDIARAISFLLAEDASLITGAILDVTGGVNVVHQSRK